MRKEQRYRGRRVKEKGKKDKKTMKMCYRCVPTLHDECDY